MYPFGFFLMVYCSATPHTHATLTAVTGGTSWSQFWFVLFCHTLSTSTTFFTLFQSKHISQLFGCGKNKPILFTSSPSSPTTCARVHKQIHREERLCKKTRWAVQAVQRAIPAHSTSPLLPVTVSTHIFSSSQNRQRRVKKESQDVATYTVRLSTHQSVPTHRLGNTNLNHGKFRRFKIEHHHFQSQVVSLSSTKSPAAPGGSRAEAKWDSWDPAF